MATIPYVVTNFAGERSHDQLLPQGYGLGQRSMILVAMCQ